MKNLRYLQDDLRAEKLHLNSLGNLDCMAPVAQNILGPEAALDTTVGHPALAGMDTLVGRHLVKNFVLDRETVHYTLAADCNQIAYLFGWSQHLKRINRSFQYFYLDYNTKIIIVKTSLIRNIFTL